MKAKLTALVLAAGLGVTGIAMTAQAAESGCSHAWENAGRSYQYCEEASSLNHARHTVQEKKCTICGTWGYDDDVVYEGHTLVFQNYDNVWKCVDCGYTE